MADKKISELTALTTVTGNEMLPISVNGSNKRAALQTLKPYFRDSTMMMFADVVDGTIAVIVGTAKEEDGATLEVVYSSHRKTFVLRKRNQYNASSYYSEWSTKGEYIDDNVVRKDRVFFRVSNGKQYRMLGGVFTVADYTSTEEVKTLVLEEQDRAIGAENHLTTLISDNTRSISKANARLQLVESVNTTQNARIESLEKLVVSGGGGGDINTAILTAVQENTANIALLKAETINEVKSDKPSLLMVETKDRSVALSVNTCTIVEAKDDPYADGLVTARDVAEYLSWMTLTDEQLEH